MAQINNTFNGGSVSVENGSNIVTAVGVDLISLGVRPGMLFKAVRNPRERVDYLIATAPETVGDNQQFTLTGNYTGASGSGLSYAITTGYTPYRNYAEVDAGDADPAVGLKRTLRQIDADMADAISGDGFKGGWNAADNLPALPAASAENNGWCYVVTVPSADKEFGSRMISNGIEWVWIPAPGKGDKGDPGDAATIAVGVVTTGAPGSQATVSNAGSSAAAVFDFTIPAGANGAAGPAGADGSAATIAVGTVTASDPGGAAAVENAGTSGAAVLNFIIPRGERGLPGNATAYDAGATYAIDAQVYEGTDVYYSLQAGNAGNTPSTSPTWWQRVNFGAQADWNAESGLSKILNKPVLGTASALDVGTIVGTVAAGDDDRFVTILDKQKLSGKKFGNFYFSATPYAVPILSGTRHRLDPSSIIRVGGTYYIYYTRLQVGVDLSGSWENILDGAEIWYATAPSLTGPWTEQAAVLVPNAGNAAAWDHNCVFTPEIIVDGGMFYLFFNAMNGAALSSNKDGIGVATSADPAGPFTKYASNPVVSPSVTPGDWDYLKANGSGVVKLLDGTWRIYYKGRPDVSGPNRKIGFAWATAVGFPYAWEKYGPPILGYGVNGSTVEYEDPGVTIINGRYYMMTNRISGDNTEEVVWLESDDGINGWAESESFQPLCDHDFEPTWAGGIHLGFSTAALNSELLVISFGAARDYAAGDYHSIGLVFLHPTEGRPTAAGNITTVTADSLNNLETQSAEFCVRLWRNGRPYMYSLPDVRGVVKPAGGNQQLQFNDNGAFAGASQFYWDKVYSLAGIGTNVPTTSLTIDTSATPGAAGFPCLLIQGEANKERFEMRSRFAPAVHGRRFNGTLANATAAAANDILLTFGGGGYFGTSGSYNPTSQSGNSGAITFRAAEAFSGTAHGTYVTISTTPVGSTSGSLTERLRITDKGNVILGNNGGAAADNLPTNATDGYLYIPVISALPNGTPTPVTGHSPLAFDVANNRLCVHNGSAWRYVSTT